MRTYKHSLFDIFKSKKRYDIWTKEYWKSYAENVHQKLIPDHPFLILVNNLKQPLHARNSFTNQIFWKRIFKKALKKLTLFFFLTACHLYVTRMYSYATCMFLVCTRMSFVCHSSVVLPWTLSNFFKGGDLATDSFKNCHLCHFHSKLSSLSLFC